MHGAQPTSLGQALSGHQGKGRVVVYVTLRGLPESLSKAPRPPGGRVARAVVLLGIVSLLTDVSSETVNAVLPIYLTAQLGLGLLAFGFIDGLYQGVSAADATEQVMLGRAFGVHRTLDTIGATLGPIVAFALLLAVPGGYDSVFIVSFWFAVVGVAVIVIVVPNSTTVRDTVVQRKRSLLTEIAGPRLRRPLVAAGLPAILTVGDAFLYLSLQQRDDMAAKCFPLLFVATNIAYFTLAVPLGRPSDRIGRTTVYFVGYVC